MWSIPEKFISEVLELVPPSEDLSKGIEKQNMALIGKAIAESIKPSYSDFQIYNAFHFGHLFDLAKDVELNIKRRALYSKWTVILESRTFDK